MNQKVSNSLLQPSSLQYGAPEFDKHQEQDYDQALTQAIAEQEQELEELINNPEPATFTNTIAALETMGKNLNKVSLVVFNLYNTDGNQVLNDLITKFSPILAQTNDKIYLNSTLYKRIKKVAENKAELNKVDQKLVEVYLNKFNKAGAALNDQDKTRLEEINQELATIKVEINNKILFAMKKGGILVDQASDLDGLSDDEIAQAQQLAKELGEDSKYYIPLVNTTSQPYFSKLKNREVRKALFQASVNRAAVNSEYDTSELALKIIKLRLEKAKLLQSDSYSSYYLKDQMSKTPEKASELLSNLTGPALAKYQKEKTELQEFIKQQGEDFKLEAWDWHYYAEQVRKIKYAIDEQTISEYFELNNVINKGIFFIAEKLYGLTLKKRTDLPLYNPTVEIYEVFNKQGESFALFYLDAFARDNKRGGAWMSSFANQSYLEQQNPIIINVLNIPYPGEGKPVLITFDQVITIFHEFGHALHGLLSEQQWPTLAGTNVATDFVELPSQYHENWVLYPEVLNNFALHYQTGETIPQELVNKLVAALNFNQGYAIVEALAAARFDLELHSITDQAKLEQISSLADYENQVLTKYNLLVAEIPPRYHANYFAHIFGNGYASSYYAYLWAEVLDCSAFEWVENHGGLTAENGKRFKDYILSVGNSIDLEETYNLFKEGPANINALLKKRGLA